MKKFFLVLNLTLFCLIIHSQKNSVFFGMNKTIVSSWKYEIYDFYKSKVKTKPNFTFGYSRIVPLKRGCSSLEFAIQYAQVKYESGGVLDKTGDPMMTNHGLKLSYEDDFKLEHVYVPITLNQIFNLNDGLEFVLSGGFYVGINLSQKYSVNVTNEETEESLSLSYRSGFFDETSSQGSGELIFSSVGDSLFVDNADYLENHISFRSSRASDVNLGFVVGSSLIFESKVKIGISYQSKLFDYMESKYIFYGHGGMNTHSRVVQIKYLQVNFAYLF